MNATARCLLVAAAGLAAGAGAGRADELVPQGDNIEITTHTVIKPGTYRLSDADGNGVIRIVGDNVSVDFQAAELVGAGDAQAPDTYTGTGILVTGRGVILKNARVRGFKVGVHARGASGLRIEDCDVSGNYRQHLKSTPLREDLADWLSPHAND